MENKFARSLQNPRSTRIALLGGIAFSLAFTALIWWGGLRLASERRPRSDDLEHLTRSVSHNVASIPHGYGSPSSAIA